MSAIEKFRRYFSECPLVAILRGIAPDEADAVGAVLVEAGIRIIEVPLNSPEAVVSVGRLARRCGNRALIGAGTVLRPREVAQVAAAGGELIVSPSVRSDVIVAAVAAGLVSVPGYFTPTEAFAAIDAGAHALKLFPAELAPPAAVRAHRAVLPRELPLVVVGGVGPDSMAAYLAAGADGFGVGSALYRPGAGLDDIALQAGAHVRALAAARGP